MEKHNMVQISDCRLQCPCEGQLDHICPDVLADVTTDVDMQRMAEVPIHVFTIVRKIIECDLHPKGRAESFGHASICTIVCLPSVTP